MNLPKKVIAGTALTGVLAMADLGAIQAADLSWGWTMMRPLYAVSFDVGREHVLSYFLSKNGLCDLTVMVTDRPDEAREGNEIPTLTTARLKAEIDGGKTAQLNTAQGKALEYACATDAQAMGVRVVKQFAASSPPVKEVANDLDISPWRSLGVMCPLSFEGAPRGRARLLRELQFEAA